MTGRGGVTTTIEDANVQAALARLAGLATDPAPVLDEIGDNLTEMRRARFLRGQGPGRIPWKPKRRVKDRKDKPLVFSGRLRDTLAWRRQGAAVLIGSDLPYARIHEFGGVIRHYAYARKVAFRRVKGVDAAGNATSRFLFARTRGKGAHKRVETRVVTFGERAIRIPARPFLGVDADDRDEVSDIVARHLRRLGATGGA